VKPQTLTTTLQPFPSRPPLPQDIEAGAEVHNTYGEHGNAELVLKYGFALLQNPWTTVTVAPRDLEAAADAVLGSQVAQQRCKFLRTESSVLDADEADAMEVSHGARLNPPLALALIVLGAPESAFGTWTSVSDAVTSFNAAAGKEGCTAAGGEEEETSEDSDGEEIDLADVALAADGQALQPQALRILQHALRTRQGRYPAVTSWNLGADTEAALLELFSGAPRARVLQQWRRGHADAHARVQVTRRSRRRSGVR